MIVFISIIIYNYITDRLSGVGGETIASRIVLPRTFFVSVRRKKELKYQTQFFVCCKDANISFCKDLKDIHKNWSFRRWNQVFHLVRTVSSNTSGFSIYLRIRITMSLGYQKWHLNLSWYFLEWAQVMWNVFERLSRLFLSRTYFLHSSDIYKVWFWLHTLERIAHVSSRSMRDPSLFITFEVKKGINTSV